MGLAFMTGDMFEFGSRDAADPCSVPESLQTNNAYDPAKENRSQTILDNCTAQGADFTQIDLSGVPTIPTFGIKNVLDKEPELIDISAGSNRGNMVTFSGYDLFGSSYFLNGSYKF